MQISESSISGLKRELKVVIGQGELGERFANRLDEFKDQVQIRGFRKGKVPVAHLKKLYGRSVVTGFARVDGWPVAVTISCPCRAACR